MPASRPALALAATAATALACTTRPTPHSAPVWRVEAGAAECPAPPSTDGGLPQLFVRANADTPWLEVMRALDGCRARWAARIYLLELAGPAPRTSRPLSFPRTTDRGMVPPAFGAKVDPSAPVWRSVELDRGGHTFVDGRGVGSAAELGAALNPGGDGPAPAVGVTADGQAPFAQVLDLLTQLQERGLDPKTAVSLSAPR
jgi:hypothetical protein